MGKNTLIGGAFSLLAYIACALCFEGRFWLIDAPLILILTFSAGCVAGFISGVFIRANQAWWSIASGTAVGIVAFALWIVLINYAYTYGI